GRAHLFPALHELATLFRSHVAGLVEDRARALALFRTHLLEAAHATARAFALVRRQVAPTAGMFEQARTIVRRGVPALAQRRHQQFALFGTELFPSRQG